MRLTYSMYLSWYGYMQPHKRLQAITAAMLTFREADEDNHCQNTLPDSKAHGANMGPTWVMSAPDGPHVDPMNLAIRAYI